MAIFPIKPQNPVINRGDSLSKGLIFNPSLSERGMVSPYTIDLISKVGSTGLTGSAPAWKTEIYGPAIVLNGSNVIGWPANFNVISASTFSIFALINPTTITGNQSILGVGDVAGIYFRLVAATLDLVKNQQVDLGASSSCVVANVPQFVGVTYNASGVVTYYRNGAFVSTVTNAQTFTARIPQIGAVGNGVGFSEFFTGNIGYIGFWNRELKAQEVNRLYSNPFKIYSQPSYRNTKYL